MTAVEVELGPRVTLHLRAENRGITAQRIAVIVARAAWWQGGIYQRRPLAAVHVGSLP